MSQDHLQTYFREHPIRHLASGSQAVVYGTEDVVVKDLRLGSIQRMIQRVLDPDKRLDMVERVRNTHREGLTQLGAVAVPYEIPPEICVQVQRKRLWGSSVKECVFKEPIVQVRTQPGNSLNTRLRDALKDKNAEEVNRLLQEVLRLNAELASMGFQPYDIVSSNYVLDRDERLRIQDIGGLVFEEKYLEAARQVRGRMLMNCLLSFKLGLSPFTSPEILKIFDEFERRFRENYLKDGPQRSRRDRRQRAQRMPKNVLSTIEQWR